VAHKYPNVLIHFVFSTKARQALIPDDLQPKLWRYFAGIGKNHALPVLAAGGISNHAHLLVSLPSDVTMAKAIQVLKANSSRWLGEHAIRFAWQEGYGAFSVSASNKNAVVNYIEHQAEHHAKRTFESEYVSLLTKSGVTFQREEALD